jgi:hypothetical protein
MSIRDDFVFLRDRCHVILEALKILWMDRDGELTDLTGSNVGHHLEVIGRTAAVFEPILPTMAEHFALLGRISRQPYGTIAFTACSTTEYIIRHGCLIAQGIDAAFRDRSIRKGEGLSAEEREVYRRSWRGLQEPFRNSGWLPTLLKCLEYDAEVE